MQMYIMRFIITMLEDFPYQYVLRGALIPHFLITDSTVLVIYDLPFPQLFIGFVCSEQILLHPKNLPLI